MNFIHTFYTNGKNVLEDGFGFNNAKYNLLSWSLSCFALKALNQGSVILYTDEQGKKILIDELGLPYDRVFICEWDFRHHWALSKIFVYSQQKEPFIHVDGDVYVSKPITEKLLSSELICQNKEIITRYYGKMVEELMAKECLKLPEFILNLLKKKKLASYNMGVFGGSDLEFIHNFCQIALQFILDNDLLNKEGLNRTVNCNVLFEQIFFGTLADANNKNVDCVFKNPNPDGRYKWKQWADLKKWEEKPMFHVIGGLKKEKATEYWLDMLVESNFPEHYKKINNLVNLNNNE